MRRGARAARLLLFLGTCIVPVSHAIAQDYNGNDTTSGPFNSGIQNFNGNSTLNASAANAVSGGTQNFYQSSILNASAANAISGGTQTFVGSTTLNASFANAVNGGTQNLEGNSTLNAMAANAISGGTQTFNNFGKLNASVADAVSGGIQTFNNTSTLNISGAGTVSGGEQTFYGSSILNASVANALSGGTQTFYENSWLNASASNAVNGGTQNFGGTNALAASAANAVSDGTQNFSGSSFLDATAAGAIGGGTQTFYDNSFLKAAVSSGVNGGSQTFNGTSHLDASVANAVSGGTQTFWDRSVLNASAADAVSGGTQLFHGSSTLNASVANAIDGGFQGAIQEFYDSSVENASAAHAISGGAFQTFQGSSVLNASAANAVSGGNQFLEGSSVLNASATNAVSGGYQTFYEGSTLKASVADAVSGGIQTFYDNSTLDVLADNALTTVTNIHFNNSFGGVGGTVRLNSHSTAVGGLTSDLQGSGQIVNGGTADATLTIDTSRVGNTVFSGLLEDGGAGTLALKMIGGKLTLTGANTYTGGTFIDGGVLSVAADNNLGAASGGLSLDGGTLAATASFDSQRTVTLGADGGSFDVASSATLSLEGSITGTGALTKQGAGTLTLTGGNDYSGGTVINGGTISVAADNSLGAASGRLILNGGTLAATDSFDTQRAVTLGAGGGTFDVSNAATLGLGGAISGGDLVKQGAGTLVLSGANGYGNTQVEAGELIGNAGSISGDIANAGIVRFDQAAAASFAGDIAGLGGVNGAMVKVGAGVLTLTGTSSLDWQIKAGGLSTSAGRFTGNAAIGSASALTFDQASADSYAGVVSGSGAFAVTGTGSVLLTGDSSGFAGTTTITNATLLVGDDVNGRLGGSVLVGSGGTLGGMGSVGSAGSLVSIASGGTLSAGGDNGIGTLTVNGDLTLAAGSTSRFQLNTPGLAGGSGAAANDLVHVNGNLTLGGTLDARVAAAGYYRLFEYGGTLSGAYAGGTVTGVGGFLPASSDADIRYNVPGQVNLSVLGTGQTMQFWDGADTTGNGRVDGGAGTWGSFGTNWTNSDGSANGGWSGSVGVFAGTASAVTVQGVQTFDTLQFSSDGYRVQGDALAIGVVGGGIFNIDKNVTATIASDIIDGGGSSLVKVGDGTLVLEGAKTYTGGTVINGGILSVAADNSLGAASGGLTLDGGTLATTASFNNSRAITLGAGGGSFDVASGATISLDGTVSGAGDLVKQGRGTLVLSGANAYGNTRVEGGLLQGDATSIAGDIGNAGTVVFDQAADARFAGNIVGLGGDSGTMRKQGAGVLTLTGTSSLDWTIVAGGLTTAAGRFTGDAAVSGGATFTFAQTSAETYAGILSDSGAFAVTGTGSVLLTGDSSGFAGTTTVTGTLLVGDAAGGKLGGSVTVGTGGTLGGSGTVGSGAGSLVTIASGGTLAAGGANAAGMLTVNGDLKLDAGSTSRFRLNGSGGNDLVVVNGDLTLGGTLDARVAAAGYYGLFAYSGSRSGTYAGGTVSGVNGFVPTTSVADIRYDVPGQVNLSVLGLGQTMQFWDGTDTTGNGAVDGGAGTWRSFGTNWTTADGSANGGWAGSVGVFTGTAGKVTVQGVQNFDTLQFKTDGYRVEGDALAIAVAGGGTFNIDRNVTATIASDIIDGVGSSLVKVGDGTLVLEGAKSYTGGTVINGGILSVAADNSLGAASGTLSLDGGTLAATASFDSLRTITLGTGGGGFDVASGAMLGLQSSITGAGDLVKQGSGTLVLSGANAYRNTLVQAGTLIGNAGSISGDIGNAGTVVFDQAADARFAGNIVGLGGDSGTMRKQGAGTLTLAGASSLDWSIDAGGLTTAAARFTGNAAIGSGGTLTFDQAGAETYAGVLSGQGAFAVTGTGGVLLTGDSSGFAGTTTITNATLLVGDAGTGALGGSVLVGTGATLGGTGTVGSGAGSRVTVASGGTLSPGNSIGTLTVNGNLTFESGSRFAVEVDPQGSASDLVHVTGNVTLNGGAVAHVGADGSYKLRSSYTILTAAGTLTGRFDSVTSDFAFLTPDLTYDYGAGTINLTLARNDIDFASAALTRNQIATARGIESIGLAAGNPVYDAIALLPGNPGLIRASFDQLSGEIHASAKSALIEDSRFVREAATDRLRAAFGAVGLSAPPVTAYGDGGPALAPATADRFAVWGQGFGSWGRFNGDGNAAKLQASTGGFLMGADAPLGSSRFGLVGGYSSTSFDVTERASSGSSDSYHLGLYGGTQWGALGFRSGLAYSWNDIDTSRLVSIPGLSNHLTGSYTAGTFQAFGELGYRIDAPSVSFEPFANLAYVSLHTNGFTETGGAAALSASSMSTDTTFTTLGLRGAAAFDLGGMTGRVRGMVGWRHAFGDTTPLSALSFAGSDAFTVAGVPIAADAAVVDAGLDLDLTSTATIGIAYQGQFGDGANRNGLNARFSVKF